MIALHRLPPAALRWLPLFPALAPVLAALTVALVAGGAL